MAGQIMFPRRTTGGVGLALFLLAIGVFVYSVFDPSFGPIALMSILAGCVAAFFTFRARTSSSLLPPNLLAGARPPRPSTAHLQPSQPHDRRGRRVAVGTKVRVLSIPASLLRAVPLEERPKLEGMVGGVFTVSEIDESGQPWVEKTWHAGPGGTDSNGLALAPHEMEVVNEDEGAA